MVDGGESNSRSSSHQGVSGLGGDVGGQRCDGRDAHAVCRAKALSGVRVAHIDRGTAAELQTSMKHIYSLAVCIHQRHYPVIVEYFGFDAVVNVKLAVWSTATRVTAITAVTLPPINRVRILVVAFRSVQAAVDSKCSNLVCPRYPGRLQ